MNHRRVPLGVIYLVVALIPFVNVATLGCIVYFGLNGNRIAVLSGRFTDEAEFVAVQNAWRNWSWLTALPLFLLLAAGLYNVST
jgi:hypothetical protein